MRVGWWEEADNGRMDVQGRPDQGSIAVFVRGGGEAEPVAGRLGSVELIAKPAWKCSFAFVFSEGYESSDC
jgi:hypothetical protein